MRNRVTECEWRHAPEACRGLGEIWRKSRELKLDAERGGSTFGARWGETNLRAMGAARDRGQMKKPASKDCVSPPYVETFNSKVIKRFRNWTKKPLRVFEFRDSYVLYVYMYLNELWTIDVHFPDSHIMAMVHSFYLRISFLSHIEFFLFEIYSVCCVKYIYRCISFDFCFLVFVVRLIFLMSCCF